MKKMTVTELNTLTDYVVESVLAQKRDEFVEKKTNITKEEFDNLAEEGTRLCEKKKELEEALQDVKKALKKLDNESYDKTYMGKRLYVNEYCGTVLVSNIPDADLFEGTNLAPTVLRKEVERKFILKNLGSEVDVEDFIKELVASY